MNCKITKAPLGVKKKQKFRVGVYMYLFFNFKCIVELHIYSWI
jgi:hypothetical protein